MKTASLTMMLCSLLAATPGASCAAEPIRLGAVLPLSIAAGRQSANAMKLAVEEINKSGGVIGRPLELIVADDEMKGDKGAAAIEKLAAEDKVDFFVGGMSSGVHLAQIPVMKKYGKVTVWIGAASSKVEKELKDQDWYFHMHTWDYEQTEQQLNAWRAIVKKHPEIKAQKWFLVHEDGAYGVTTYSNHQAAFPKDWTLKGVDFKSIAVGGTGDYRMALKRAQEFRPDVFLWVGYEADALPLTRQLQESGYKPPILAGMPPGWPSDFGKESLAEGVCIYDAWLPTLKIKNPHHKDFLDTYRSKYNEDPESYFPPLAYTSILVLADGLKRAGSVESNALIAALEKTRFPTLFDTTVTFAPSRIIKHQGGMNILKVMQWQKGVLQVIYPFEYATARLQYPYGKK